MLPVTVAFGATPDEYMISIGDELELDILDDSEPPQRFVVGGNGQVQLPFIGGVSVENTRLSDARDLIARSYIEREIFIAPRVELSVASFRPIFVIGDVKTPGNYNYQPFLTAEQAAGLAGGAAVSTNNAETRVLEKRSIEGSLSGLRADLARRAAQLARVRVQIAGGAKVGWGDVPSEIRSDIDRTLFDELTAAEDQIIALDAQSLATRRGLLTDAIAEAENRIDLMGQRHDVLVKAVESNRVEVNRSKDLVTRGLRPVSTLADDEQAQSRLEGELLRLGEERSAALVQVNTLRSDLTELDTLGEKELLTEAQSLRAAIAQGRADLASAQDRILLLTQWITSSDGPEADLLVEYLARRRTSVGMEEIALQPFEELQPGDLLMVRIRPPEALDGREQKG
ncbi:polysaccharide biosynthesis/export family protein [Gemmobacter sp. 24YEA27]|uniref:polysaccharide biosynthesis/export family protein n=1 Tax=Gemmobacter sp. 24YEA27 TaxID=3040672 RepID=UPI0024B379E7|nr:polysaccharide biosynthesis/export family protein [Gemmobacter sp. 24YEA27]